MNLLIIGKKKSDMMRSRCQKVEDHAPLMDILCYKPNPLHILKTLRLWISYVTILVFEKKSC
jgi:hypothetical protein